jgi:hypothetical protein
MSSPLPYCRTNQTSSDVGMIGMITARRTGDAMEPGENSSMISRARACGRTRKGGRIVSCAETNSRYSITSSVVHGFSSRVQ